MPEISFSEAPKLEPLTNIHPPCLSCISPSSFPPPSHFIDDWASLPYRTFQYRCTCSLCCQPQHLQEGCDVTTVTFDELRYLPLGPLGRWQSSLGAEAIRKAEAALAVQGTECASCGVSSSETRSSSPSDCEDSRKRTGTFKRGRSWSDEERERHKQACRGKGRLSAGERLEIVRMHHSKDPQVHKSKAELAAMFGKSLSAISKALKPENIVKWAKAEGQQGVSEGGRQ
eukprot:767294-Hanusia_phi.AAC.6